MLKLFKALQVKAVCLGVISILLVVSSMLGAGHSSGVTANVLYKTSVTGDGQKIVYPQTDKAGVTAMIVNIAPEGPRRAGISTLYLYTLTLFPET